MRSRLLWPAGGGLLLALSALGAWGVAYFLASRSPPSAPGNPPNVAGAAPVLAIEPRDPSAQVYEEVTAIPYRFTVTNVSAKPVQIVRVQPECGCTEARLSASKLEPQQSAVLVVVYEVPGLFGDLPRRNVILQTDDPDCPRVQCSVGGSRQQRFRIEPASVDFSTVLVGSGAQHVVTVDTNGPDMRLVPEMLTAPAPWVHVRPVRQEPLREGTRWVLEVSLDKKAPVGQLDGRLFIPREQNDGLGPVIPVRGEVVGPLQTVPAQAFLGILKPDATAARTVDVKPVFAAGSPSGPRTVRIVGFGETPAGLRLRVDDKDPARVHVTGQAAELGSGKFLHKVVVQCALDGETCDLLLPVSGMVSP